MEDADQEGGHVLEATAAQHDVLTVKLSDQLIPLNGLAKSGHYRGFKSACSAARVSTNMTHG